VNFQTNTQANNFETSNFGNFFANFNKIDKNEPDEEDFATNTFNRNNLYNDLMFQKPEEKSDWSEFGAKPEEKEVGFLADKLNSLKIEMSAKQVINKAKKMAEELKNKVVGQDESLI